MSDHDLIRLLRAAHAAGRPLDAPDPALRPADLDAAYALADALTQGQRVVGWKIGAANARGQQALGLREPFAGRVLAGTLHQAPAALREARLPLTVGAEIGCRLARDLGADERFDAASIAGAVDALVPCLELNWASYADPFGLVAGAPLADWRTLDLAGLAVRFQRDDAPPIVGAPGAAAFDPLAALAWLANDRAARGDPLRAGQIVATGDFVGAVEAGAGSLVRADFGPLGAVELALE
jgi:2-keto-4-pentenoate hydratase